MKKTPFEIHYCRFETRFENENQKRKRQRPDLENHDLSFAFTFS